ncbi:MAG: polysaccharide deacetylase family protein [Candidatus Omnitrophica bacterium]|nr:polysaccharide deacetylase family protein [Candidatus Omnitrophota bacterium]
MKKYVKKIVSWLAVYSGIARARRYFRRNLPVVLCYHRVVDDLAQAHQYSDSGMVVSRETFRRQMEFLRRHYCVISMDTFTRFLDGAGPLPQYSVLVTFDDGYKDNFTCAYPVFTELDLPVTLFVTTGFIDGRIVPEWDREVNGQRPEMLSWEEIRRMESNGVTIGAHTVTHPEFGTTDPSREEERLTEIPASKLRLEGVLGQPVEVFAYPKGSMSTAALNAVKQAGFKTAFVVRRRGAGHDRRYCWPRIPVNEGRTRGPRGETDMRMFACALAGIWK